MQQNMTLSILGARRGNVDGNNYASVYVAQRAEDGDKNNMGMLPMKLSCDFNVLDSLDPKQLPGDYECLVRLQPAAGGKVGMHLTSVRYTRPATKAAAQ